MMVMIDGVMVMIDGVIVIGDDWRCLTNRILLVGANEVVWSWFIAYFVGAIPERDVVKAEVNVGTEEHLSL